MADGADDEAEEPMMNEAFGKLLWHQRSVLMHSVAFMITLCFYPVWVPGLRIDPLRLLAGCRKRRLNQAPLNIRGLVS